MGEIIEMKIMLLNVDSKIPNIALGRLSTYWKGCGAEVLYISLGIKGFQKNKRAQIIDGSGCDRVYVSNIFTTSQNKFKVINCKKILIGGVGSIHPTLKLPPEVDECDVDYTLWPENDKSYGFITRGCIRKCKFCFVPKIEGKIRFENTVDSIVRHKTAIFLDNNILGYTEHLDILREIRDKKIKVQFNQGLDIRLINHENAKVLSQMRYYGKYIFAFDDIKYEKGVVRGTKIFQHYVPGKWRMRFLVYYSAEEPLCDLVYRIRWSKRHGVLPFIMRDKNCISSLYKDFLTDYCGYVGSTGGQFCKCSFAQYLFASKIIKQQKAHKERIAKTLHIYQRAVRGEI